MWWRVNWLRWSVTFTLAVLDITSPIKRLKMNKIYKRVSSYPFDDGLFEPSRITVPRQRARLARTTRPPSTRERPLGGAGQRKRPSSSYNQGHFAPDESATFMSYEYKLVEENTLLPSHNSHHLHFNNKCLISYNWYLLIKHLIVCLLRLNSLAHLRYLDCYMVGRFMVNGRVIELACYCACFLLAFKLSWYHTTTRKPDEDFKLTCFEFLLMSEDKVNQQTAAMSSSAESSKCLGDAMREDQEEAKDKLGEAHRGNEFYSAIFQFHNPFESSGMRKIYGLRPNRTPESWLSLAKSTLRFYKIFAVILGLLVIMFLRMSTPITLTQKGFDYNYRYCIQYITTERIKRERDANYTKPSRAQTYFFNLIRPSQDELGGSLGRFIFLYRPNVTKNFRLASMMDNSFLQPFENFVPLNLYHVTRIALDFLETCLIYFQTAFMLACACYTTIIVCNDVVYYCSAVNARMSKLIAIMRSISTIDLNVNEDYYYDMSIKYDERFNDQGRIQQPCPHVRLQPTRDNLRLVEADIHRVQAMIADIFTMLEAYNRYISHQLVCLILFWLGYSMLVCSWIFIPGNDSPKTEWFVLHVFATLYQLLLMVQFSSVDSECRRLYNHMVMAMALDEFTSSSKKLWTHLLKFYAPVPMFCFTMIKSIKLNIMFGLKMLAWLFSALFVASSFFLINVD